MRVVVIGGVAAGMSAASQARRRAPDADVIVFERGPHVSYSACAMPYNIGMPSRSATDLEILKPAAARARGIDVRSGHEVTAIDATNKTVDVTRLSDGAQEVVRWDSLVVATGAAAIKPPWKGFALAGVFVLRELTDAAAIKAYMAANAVTSAVIVGAGYIGLEMADVLRTLRVQVTVLEKVASVLPGWTPRIIELAMQELVKHDVRVETGLTVREIERNAADTGFTVQTDRGDFTGDIVIVCIGVRPNIALAREAGIALGPTGAIAVDAQMRTNLPGIFAAGDCIEVRHLVTGHAAYIPLGTTANRTGRIAGANAAGATEEFRGIVGSAGFKLCDMEVARTGISDTEARTLGIDAVAAPSTHHTRAMSDPGDKPMHTVMFVERETGRLLGAQSIGGEVVAKRMDIIATALHARMTVMDVEALDLTYAPPFAPVYDPVLIAATVARKAAGQGGG